MSHGFNPTTPTCKIVRQFRQALEEKKDVNKVWNILNTATKEDVLKWTDQNGLNALHYCILYDHAEATDVLLKNGYFAKPSTPAVSPYMHLAAILGFKTVLSVLIQLRPEDFEVSSKNLFIPASIAKNLVHSVATSRRKKSPPTRGGLRPMESCHSSPFIDVNKLKCGGNITASGMLGRGRTRPSCLKGMSLDGSQPLLKDPLEVAARARHVECVKLLLDMCVMKAHPDVAFRGHFSMATLANCTATLSLLFRTCNKMDNHVIKDIKRAIKMSLQNVQPECLELLLSHAPPNLDIKGIFKHINFYHVLYSLSASYGKEVCSRLPEVTQVLIRKGHDVSAKVPARTYPIYTLLTHAFSYHDQSFADCYTKCLKLLLDEGADPNYDEVELELQLRKKRGIKFSAGRKAFSSGLTCLMETLQTNCVGFSRATRLYILLEFSVLLVRHGADPCKVGRIHGVDRDLEGSVLHQFASTAVVTGMDRDFFQCLVSLGADPALKAKDKYALNVHFDKLFELMITQGDGGDSAGEQPYQDDVYSVMTLFCRFMPPAAIQEAAFFLKRDHDRSTSKRVRSFLTPVLADLDERSHQVWSLRKQTAWSLWHFCGKSLESVQSLDVHANIKSLIMPFGEDRVPACSR